MDGWEEDDMEKWRFCFFSLALSPCVARPFPSLLLLFPKLWIELKLQAGRVAAGRKPAVLATKFILRVCGCPLIYATPLICFVGVVAEPQDPHDPHAKHT